VVEQLPRLLGVSIYEEFQRPLQVGEEDGDVLALTLESSPRCEDSLGQVSGSIGFGFGKAGTLQEGARLS
jgi:hypothetical protein